MGRKMGGSDQGGTYVYLWLIHVDSWQKTTKFCKTITLQLKNKLEKINLSSGIYAIKELSCRCTQNCHVSYINSNLHND